MLPSSSSTPRSIRSRDGRFDHIIREEVAADQPDDPPAWSASVLAPSFGEHYGKQQQQQQPFWRKALMALRERRRIKLAATDDLASNSYPHKRYGRPMLSIFRIARCIGLLFLAMLGLFLCFL